MNELNREDMRPAIGRGRDKSTTARGVHVVRKISWIEGSIVLRISGGLLFVDLDNSAHAHAEHACQKILVALTAHYIIDADEVHGIADIGAPLPGSGQHSINDALPQTDLAMHESTPAGRNSYRFPLPSIPVAQDQITQLESELCQALAKDELRLHYQPIIGGDGELAGVEALIRWQHPQRGMLPPAVFISHAEKMGLIVEFGEWVLLCVCEQLVTWSNDPVTEPLTIAVNISAHHVCQGKFAERVLDILARTGANPRRLKLELTESTMLSNVDELIAKMSRLRQIGIVFSLDDFGTGYSSLSYLNELPLDQIKIDRSFVSGMLTRPHTFSIVQMIVTLGHSMGLEVVAEGVETCEQLSALRNIGCTTFQGFLFCKPKPLQDLMDKLDSFRPSSDARLSKEFCCS